MQTRRKSYEMDMISKLPLCIIEAILCLLPIQEAARTSILSKEWRYHWIGIPKLAFIEDTFQVSTDNAELSILEQTRDNPSKRKNINKSSKLLVAIHKVLSIHNGPIHEFTLSMEGDNSCVDIDHILLHLSQNNTVKKLKLDIVCEYKLPVTLFSFHLLTDLYITSGALDCTPTYNGFGNLSNLFLQEICTDEKTLMRLLSSCPKLKNLNLSINCTTIDYNDDSTIADLFECLPTIENLSVCFDIILCFAPERVPKVLPTTLVHLKYLCMEAISFIHKYGFPFLFLLIKSSPNLEKLKLDLLDDDWLDEVEIGSCKLEDYSDIWLEHLNDLEIRSFHNTKNELEFVKLIFAKSPVLKTVNISLENEIDKEQESEISRIIVGLSHASPWEFCQS